MKKRKQKKIIIPIKLYEAEYKGKEDIYWNGRIVQGTDSRNVENWCQILGHKWHYFRHRVSLNSAFSTALYSARKCKRCRITQYLNSK